MTINLFRVSRFVLLLTTSSSAFAAEETPPFFVEIASLLVVSARVAYLSYRLGLVPIIGFLAAGVLLGPSALGLVQDSELIDAAAEVGVILLLFTIGLEFSLERLARIRRIILLGASSWVAGRRSGLRSPPSRFFLCFSGWTGARVSSRAASSRSRRPRLS